MLVSVLTLDLGTSATKAALWRGSELVALARSPVATAHPAPGWMEQDPDEWWESVVEACTELRALAAEDYEAIAAIGFSAARETFALFDAGLHPVSAGILWSDRRAGREAGALGEPAEFSAATGVVLDGATPAAKLAWLARMSPDILRRARWFLHPRDVVIARMTDEVVTDETLACRTGLCAISGGWRAHATATYGERLPPIVASTTIVGRPTDEAVGLLTLPVDACVVVGAGDRACEVLGSAASARAPMVSWGTTANVSVPQPRAQGAASSGTGVSRGALGGFVVEAGLSAAGSALAWLSSLTGRSHDDLLAAAASVAPGAAGAIALPWLGGARGSWSRPDVHAAFVGLTDAHGPAELARALIEGVALDVSRCLELVAPERTEVVLAGGGAAHRLWRNVLAAVTGLDVVRRAVDDAASVGARMLVAAALGESLHVDDVNPVSTREHPDGSLVDSYRRVRSISDAAAAAVLGVRRDS